MSMCGLTPLGVGQKCLMALVQHPQVGDTSKQGTCVGLTGVRIALWAKEMPHSDLVMIW